MLTSKLQTASSAAAGAGGTYYIVHASNGVLSNRLRAWPWSSATGFGTVFADPTSSVADPIAPFFTPSGDAVITTREGGSAYQFSAAGWGTKYTSYYDINQNDMVMTPSGRAIISAKGSYPHIKAQRWSSVTGFGTEYPGPASVVPYPSYAIDISPAGDAVAISWRQGLEPYFGVYSWNDETGFGARYANPATGLGSNQNQSIKFSPAGDTLLFGSDTGSKLHAYPWSAITGVGVKYADPTVLPSNGIGQVAWHPSGNAIAATSFVSPQIHAYAWSPAGFGTKFTNPTIGDMGQGLGVAFSPDGLALALGTAGTPFIKAWRWSESGFGAVYSNPSVLPANGGVDGGCIAFGRIPAIPPAPQPDANFANVSLLLHMDGANGSTTFIDSSSNALTVTPNGNAQISTAQSKYGGASGLFDGTGDFLSMGTPTALALGTGPYVIECWSYLTATSQNFPELFRIDFGSTSLVLRYGNSFYFDRLQFSANPSQTFEVASANFNQTQALNTWIHVCLAVDSGNSGRLYINGQRYQLTTGNGTTFPYASQSLNPANVTNLISTSIGANFQGYIDDFRVTKGVDRYPSERFTPPLRAYQDF